MVSGSAMIPLRETPSILPVLLHASGPGRRLKQVNCSGFPGMSGQNRQRIQRIDGSKNGGEAKDLPVLWIESAPG
jgi:hypothetical protein